MNSLLTESATALALAIKSKAVSAREVVEAHVAHAEAVNGDLNAVVVDRYEQALAEADAADARLSREPVENLPLFHGVPCTIKESFALEGMPNSSGLVSRKDLRAPVDAVTVRRLREAGAIPIGVTNTSELCMWMESRNNVYGRTNNPYDPSRIVGGSSGGEGAIVGSGASPFGLGADIGGSIRMPAFFNGVFGHKATGGLVPGTGQYPLAENAALRYLCSGPIARRATDLMPLMRLLAGPDGDDAWCVDMALGDPQSVDIKTLKVYSIDGNGAVRVDADLRRAQQKCVDALAARGARIEPLQLDLLRLSRDIWSSMMESAADTPYAAILGAGRPVYALVEIIKWVFRRSEYTLPSIALVALERLTGSFTKRVERFVQEGLTLKARMAEALAGNSVLLYPTYPQCAPRHYKPLMPPFNWVYTAIINVMELPSTQVPLGLNGQGLPLGLQVVGLHGHDHVTIAVAQQLEEAFGGWVPPPRIFGEQAIRSSGE